MSDEPEYPFGYSLVEMDTDAFFAMRDWLEKVLVADGAEVDSKGIGMGQADIAFTHNGKRFEVSIRPLKLLVKADPKIVHLHPTQAPQDPNVKP